MKHLYIFSSKNQYSLLIKCFVFAIPFIIGLVYFYFSFYRDFKIARDLGSLGMIKFEGYQTCVDTLTDKSFITIQKDEVYLYAKGTYVISIGDSFSQQGIRGYLNYLAHINSKCSFANVDNRKLMTPEKLFMELCENGKPMPKIVILESVERSFIGRLNGLNFDSNDNTIKVKHQVQNAGDDKKAEHKKHFLNWAQEFYKKRLGIDNPVGYFPLTTEMFTCDGHDKDLYFINSKGYGDNYIDSDLAMSDSASIIKAQNKLDSLFIFATKHGVELYYVVALDKYDAYQEYIAVEHPQKSTLDDFSMHYIGNKHFLNSKDLILPKIHNGEKDMYYCDDTHWSTKSAKLVGEELSKRIFGNQSEN